MENEENHMKVGLDNIKFRILESLVVAAQENILEWQDDYFVSMLNNSMFGEKDIDEMEECEYDNLCDKIAKELSDLLTILNRSKQTFNSKMIL